MKKKVREETIKEAEKNRNRWWKAAIDAPDDDLIIHAMIHKAEEYNRVAKLLRKK